MRNDRVGIYRIFWKEVPVILTQMELAVAQSQLDVDILKIVQSHEELRGIVRRLLAELLVSGCENKEVMIEAQKALGVDDGNKAQG